jgi:hypothetical protein
MGCGSSTLAHAVSEPLNHKPLESIQKQDPYNHASSDAKSSHVHEPNVPEGAKASTNSHNQIEYENIVQSTQWKRQALSSSGKLDSILEVGVAEFGSPSKASGSDIETETSTDKSDVLAKDIKEPCAVPPEPPVNDEKFKQVSQLIHVPQSESTTTDACTVPHTSNIPSSQSEPTHAPPKGESALAQDTARRFAVMYLHSLHMETLSVMKPARQVFLPARKRVSSSEAASSPSGGLESWLQSKGGHAAEGLLQAQEKSENIDNIRTQPLWIDFTADDASQQQESADKQVASDHHRTVAEGTAVAVGTNAATPGRGRALLQDAYVRAFDDKPPRLRPMLREARRIRKRVQKSALEHLEVAGM